MRRIWILVAQMLGGAVIGRLCQAIGEYLVGDLYNFEDLFYINIHFWYPIGVIVGVHLVSKLVNQRKVSRGVFLGSYLGVVLSVCLQGVIFTCCFSGTTRVSPLLEWMFSVLFFYTPWLLPPVFAAIISHLLVPMKRVDKTMASQDKARLEWPFWLRWTLATTFGWILAPLVLLLSFGLAWFGFSIFICVVSIGLMQWSLLKRKLSQADRWVYVTIVGWVILLSAFFVVNPLMSRDLIIAALATFSVSFCQWFFFLRQRVTQAGWWIPVSFIGYVVGLGCGNFVASALGPLLYVVMVSLDFLGIGFLVGPLTSYLPFLSFWLGIGFVRGLLTGLLMTWLLQRVREPIYVCEQTGIGLARPTFTSGRGAAGQGH